MPQQRWVRARGVNPSHVVNYGHTHEWITGPRGTRVLNESIVFNKYRQLELMEQDGVRVPDHQRRTPPEAGWLCRSDQHQRGTDIREGRTTLGEERVVTTQHGRPTCPTCGHIHTCATARTERQHDRTAYPRADYYVAYIPKEREFRCHVINGASVRMCEKMPLNRPGRDVIWNSNNSHFSFAEIQPRQVRQAIRAVAKEAVEALGMDFGAVDIMWHRGEAIVLEVNSAPSLTDNDNTLERYVTHIRRWADGGG